LHPAAARRIPFRAAAHQRTSDNRVNRTLSVYPDLVRVLAAVLVLLIRLASGRFSGGLLQPLRTYGNDGVLTFFVLEAS
jgi:hypothetical protein